nr:hypothetical protein Iba_scaffold49996CG0010 [Ipomoea batatas]GME13403.1 hypothetical protein Iba_scaffold14426CG0020 [Ipomoea batatas]
MIGIQLDVYQWHPLVHSAVLPSNTVSCFRDILKDEIQI